MRRRARRHFQTTSLPLSSHSIAESLHSHGQRRDRRPRCVGSLHALYSQCTLHPIEMRVKDRIVVSAAFWLARKDGGGRTRMALD